MTKKDAVGSRRRGAPSSFHIEVLESRIAPATFIVSNLLDAGDGSLRDAIAKANLAAGLDTITFGKVGKTTGIGSIKLSSAALSITDALTIDGAGKVTVDGQNKTQLFTITGTGIDVTFSGLTLKNGIGALTVNTEIAVVRGGAIFIDDAGGKVTIKNSTITANSANGHVLIGGVPTDYDGRGGAIDNENANLVIQNSTISKNKAAGVMADGGGIFNGGTLTVELNSFVSGNTATGDALAQGGGVFNAGGATVMVKNSKVTDNSALGAKGIDGVKGANGLNGARGEPGTDGEPGEPGEDGTEGTSGGSAIGGGIYNLGTLTVQTSSISGNTALGGSGGKGGAGGKGGNGGAGGAGYGSGEYRVDAGFKGDSAPGGNGGAGGYAGTGDGGGVYNGPAGVVTIEGSAISTNEVAIGLGGKGGAAGANGSGFVSTGEGPLGGENGADGDHSAGGGISNAGALTISGNSLISKNTVTGGDASGGGIFNTGTLTVTGSTISLNTVKASAGADGAAGIDGLDGADGINGARGEPGADGEDGTDGEDGADGTDGEIGEDGHAALGGGIYSLGVVTIKTSTISGNTVTGGAAGDGGKGGAGGAGGTAGRGGAGGRAYTYDGYTTPAGHAGASGIAGLGSAGGNGGDGGAGGAGSGAGIFFASDTSGASPALKLTIEGSTISGNVTKVGAVGKAGLGGAAGPGRKVDPTEVNPSVKGDKGLIGAIGDGNGGGIYALGSLLAITQSTISGNTAAGNGGGVAGIENKSTEIHNSTIAKNTAGASGGGLFVSLDAALDAVNVISTIIALNKADVDRDVSGTIVAGFSLIQNKDGGLFSDLTNLLGLDPKLGALAVPKGKTLAVMIPTLLSPVINKGSNPDALAFDQRGTPSVRVLGGTTDIGAVEAA